jgi:hypothetical protein
MQRRRIQSILLRARGCGLQADVLCVCRFSLNWAKATDSAGLYEQSKPERRQDIVAQRAGRSALVYLLGCCRCWRSFHYLELRFQALTALQVYQGDHNSGP